MANFLTKMFSRKLNPSQPDIGGNIEPSKEYIGTYTAAYEQLEIVNRGVNMLADDAAQIPVRVYEAAPGKSMVKGVKKVQLHRLLNHEPNPFQDISTFRRNLILDLLLDGNIFIYFDGRHLYHLPANKVYIHTSQVTYVKKYTFNENVDYSPDEIIHIKENSFRSIYRGVSRLKPAKRTMELMASMRSFQDNFFKNGAVPGLVLKSPNTLSQKIKERLISSWMEKYRPDSGGKRPLVLDGGLEIDSISNINFKELDFQASITENEKIVLKALGIPPVLLDSGNNANIRPNMRMYYLLTVLPITTKMNKAFERFFGFRLEDDVSNIAALQPELSDQANYYSSLVNTGIITPNEARDNLGFEADTDPASDKLRIPANIAGSAGDPSEGGRPEQGEDTNDSPKA
jgi:HK97 family phage portal protein